MKRQEARDAKNLEGFGGGAESDASGDRASSWSPDRLNVPVLLRGVRRIILTTSPGVPALK